MRGFQIYDITPKTVDVYVWGTGDYANRTILHIQYINDSLKDLNLSPLYRIDGFIDSDKKKRGRCINGMLVVSPEDIDFYEIQCVIVAVKENIDIVRYIRERNSRIVIYTLEDLYCETPYTDQIDLLQNETRTIYLEKVINEVYHKLSSSDYLKKVWSFYSFKYLQTIIKDEKKLYDVMMEIFGETILACVLQGIFKENIDKIKFDTGRRLNKKNSETIAMIYPKLYNGGVERVLSLLFELLDNQTDYNLVYICEEIDPQNDYHLPQNIKRYVLPQYTKYDKWRWIEEVHRVLVDYEVDVLVSHDSFNLINYYIAIIAKLNGIKFLIEYHNSIYPIRNKLDKYIACFKQADGLVVLSNGLRTYFANKGISSFYIPNPVKKIEYVDNEYKDGIIWVGRITQEQKNVFAVIPVVEAVKKQIGDVKLYIVGKSDDNRIMEELKKRIHKHGLDSNIDLVGYRTDISDYYLHAKCIIMTSKYEGFPMTIVESKQYGLPLVAFELQNVEILKDNRGYVSVPYNHYGMMADAVVRILRDDIYRKRMSKDAIESINEFLKYNIVDAWEKALRNEQ